MFKASIGLVMLLAVTTILLTACERQPQSNMTVKRPVTKNQQFTELQYLNGLSMLRDNVTGCQYIWTNSGITPRYASNGQVLCTQGVSMK